jgi:spermidine synthase
VKIRSFKVSLIVMGLSGIIGQIVLLRELLVSFYGNEITLGIILANWLIIEAMGSFWIGKSVERTPKKREIYGLLQLIFSVAFPIALTLSRTFKNIILTVPGEELGFGAIFGSSFLILLPVSLSHGALFTYGCRLYSEVSREGASSVGKVYILETLGTLLGGLLVTFLLVQYLNPFQIVFIISLTNAAMTLILLWPEDRPHSFTFRNGLWGVSLVLTLLFCLLLIPPTSKDIHETLIRSQWREMDVVRNENSVYGNITVTKRGDQYTFFTDGTPSITTPVPDLSSVEDVVHFPMLLHEKPETVLILHGGAGGMISEILKYPVTRIDYVELDPLLLKLVRTYSTPLTQSELSDKRVHIHDEDGRFFVKKTPSQYDVILIGLTVPQELQSNRLFTSEFFSMAKNKMTRDGMIVLALPGSLTYISPELRDLNGCILDTLRSVYRQVRVIPGDVNLYLASNSDQLANVTAKEVIQRFQERRIKASLFTPGYIESRLQDRWLQWFYQSMGERKVRINSDYRPLAVFYNLSHWNALFSPYLAGVFKWFEQLSFKLTIPSIALLTLLIAAIFVRWPLLSQHAITYAVFTSGWTGMIFELAIIFTFQTLYGYLYHQIGLLIAVFMAGIATGSLCVTRLLSRIKADAPLFLKTEGGLVLFSVILPFLFSIPAHHLEKPAVPAFLYATFLAASLISGTLIGMQFPLAAQIYLHTPSTEGSVGSTAGLLYGADLFGGFFGGLFGGILFLPVLGLRDSCFTVAIIKLSSFSLFLLYLRMKPGRRTS